MSSKRADALEVALESLGPFGLYQKYMLIMLCLPNLLSAMYGLNYIFVAQRENFRCVVPECEGYSPDYFNTTTELLLSADSCSRYVPLHDASEDTCSREAYHENDTLSCDIFTYETSDSIFSEFDLACREWMRTMVGTVRNSALPFALVLTGFVSDKFGRRTALCVFSSFAAVMGIIKSFSINYQMYLAMEFLEAALGYGFNGAAYVMMVELARPNLRAAFACATGIAYGLGGIAFAYFAWRIRYWRHLLVTIHSLALLLPLYWLLVDESPRWLHANNKNKETEAIIRKIAKWNKVTLNEDHIQNLYSKEDESKDDKPMPNPWLSLLRSKVLLLRWAACAWCWIAVAFVYYGLTINSVLLSGDQYINFALNMAMEVVASVLLMMALERFGRKWSIFIAFLMCAIASITPFYVTHTGTGLGMFFLGKLAITFAFNSIYVFTAELFPTRVRSSALSACSLIGRIGSILAPQTPLLSVFMQAALYGISCATAALAISLIPETRRANLPADIESAETLHPVADIDASIATATTSPSSSSLPTLEAQSKHVA